jgi:exodeoxyribonuclease V alpha subunit
MAEGRQRTSPVKPGGSSAQPTQRTLRRYLGSGLVAGIGPVFAERIVTHFGLDTLRVIEEEPSRLVQVPGLGPKRTATITAAWQEQQAIKEVMVFLQGVGVSTSLAVRIFKRYGDGSIAVVTNEPYRLAAEVWGIGFKTADTVARSVGIPHDSRQRVKAGLQYTLSEATDNGHCYLPAGQLVTDATKILDVPPDLVAGCLDELVAEDGVVRELLPGPGGEPVPGIYLVPLHRAEQSLAGSLLRLLHECADRNLARPSTADGLARIATRTRRPGGGVPARGAGRRLDALFGSVADVQMWSD